MSKQKKESYFWTSYSDLMTSLFFVMLVLFVLTIAILHRKMVGIEDGRQASQRQLDKIKEIEEAVNNIDSTYFDYSQIYKKHILNIKVNFPIGKSNVNELDHETIRELILAGNAIQNSLDNINRYFPEIQYLLIIEGQASRSVFMNPNECRNNDVLSYQRALALKEFWDVNEIRLEDGDNCEVIIGGSGIGGVPRELPDDLNCTKNQRFLIHIVPKPGIIEASKQMDQ